MTLSIPNRTKPGKNSFPGSPESVRDWLADIKPLRSIDSVKTLYRGLKHGNRLETSARNRAEVAEILEPAVLESLTLLEQHFFGHALPLQQQQNHARRLHESLLLELAHSWKLIVNETYATLLPGQSKSRSTGIYKSLRTLARLIESYLTLQQPVPRQVLEDVNTLYQFAVKSRLTDKPLTENNRDLKTDWSIGDAYAYAITLSMFNAFAQRRTRIPELCFFLSDNIDSVKVLEPDQDDIKSATHGVFLEQDAKPLPVEYTGGNFSNDRILIDVSGLMLRIDEAIEQASASSPELQTTESIEPTALEALKRSFERRQNRSSLRAITRQPVIVSSGLLEVSATLNYPSDVEDASQGDRKSGSVHWPVGVTGSGSWSMVNNSKTGACLLWEGRNATNVDVGDVLSLNTDLSDPDCFWRAALIRWISTPADNQLRVGVEYVDGDIKPIRLGNTHSQNSISAPPALRDCLLIIDQEQTDGDVLTLLTPVQSFEPDMELESEKLERFRLGDKMESTSVVDRFSIFRSTNDAE